MRHYFLGYRARVLIGTVHVFR